MTKKLPRNKFEQSGWDFLIQNKVKFKYEGLKLPYTIEANYNPDFYIPKKDLIIEFKGYWRAGAKRKMAAVRKAHPKVDIRIVLYSPPNKVDQKWLQKNNFQYAVGQIPKSWIK